MAGWLVGWSVGWSVIESIVWFAACLFGELVGWIAGWLCWLVGLCLSCRIVWMTGRLMSCWMVGGMVGWWFCWMVSELVGWWICWMVGWLAGWLWAGCLVNGSIGYWVLSSVIWWNSGLLCRSVSRSFIRIVSGPFDWSIARLFGCVVESCAWSVFRSVCCLGSGWGGWLVDSFVCFRSVGGLVGQLIWSVGSVSWCVGCFSGGLVSWRVAWLVACVGQAVSESFGE